MPEGLSRRVREVAAHGPGWVPPPALDAATVALLRDTPAGLEVLLLRRVPSMAFAPGMHVFPGGRVDAADAGADVPWAPGPGYDLAVQAARLRAAPGVHRALVVAAVREVFEETGVLLAVGPGGAPPAQPAGGWEAQRQALLASGHPDAGGPGEGGGGGVAAVLAGLGLTVDPAVLPLWGHWVTPEVEPRRFDTRFFVAALPAGQQAVDVGGESDQLTWLRPADALAGAESGTTAMLPPTSATLAELAEFATAADALAAAAARTPRPLMPRPVLAGDSPDAPVRWVLADAYDGTVLADLPADAGGPASETRGTR